MFIFVVAISAHLVAVEMAMMAGDNDGGGNRQGGVAEMKAAEGW